MRRYELYHHGIKGQKWGIRNGPPYPIEDKVLKKGTRINSVSGSYLNSDDYKNSGKWMYTYRKDEEWDNKVYKGPFSIYLIQQKGAQFVKEHEYEVVEDLKMPTKKERIQEFKNLWNNKETREHVIEDLEQVRKAMIKYDIGTEEAQERYKNLDTNNLIGEKDWQTAYELFGHAMEYSWKFNSTQDYVKTMESKYDAMIDDNNQGIYNDAHDPIIIFRANEVLRTVSDVEVSNLLSADEIIDNYNDVAKEMNKQGKGVLF